MVVLSVLAILVVQTATPVSARIGGEEFAVILPETGIVGALEVAEKIRAAMTISSDLKHPLTLSMGVSTLHRDDVKADVLIQQADLALYQAKRTGRNRICIFEDKSSEKEIRFPEND